MEKPTQQQLNKFWEEATEGQLRDIMKYAKDKEVRDKASKLYKWEQAEEEHLRNIMVYAADKEIRDKVSQHSPVDVYEYLINK